MTGLKSILSHSPSVVTRKTGNEYVLVPVSNNIADMNSVYTLNETGKEEGAQDQSQQDKEGRLLT